MDSLVMINAAQPAPGPAAYSAVLPADYVGRFIEFTDRRDTTSRNYISCIRRFTDWMNDNSINRPSREDVQAYKKYLEGSGLSVGTQGQYLRAVRHFFRWLATEGIYPNIADNIHGPKVRRDIHKKDALGKEDVKNVADSIDRTTETGKRLYAIFMLCITCGLRCIEVSRANIEDVKTINGRTYLYVWGKGHDEPDAPVLLIQEVKDAITDYLQAREIKPQAKGPLFVSSSNNSKGARIAPTTISTQIKKALIAAGYDSDRITAHSLRHTSGTGAYLATGNIYEAQKHQRHTSPETTEIYVHAAERETRNTEQQVYNYYFSDEDTEEARKEAHSIIESMTAEELEAFIKSQRKEG